MVDHFVHSCPREMAQLEQWGCPWSRKPDGSVNVRRFGGMKIERTWFAADKTGFHMLHTLFQTSLKYPQIQRFDEHFVLDVLVDDGQARGVVAMNMMEGTRVQIRANAVIMPPAVQAVFIAITPTAASSPATVWGWRSTTAYHCATWSLCNITQPACQAQAS